VKNEKPTIRLGLSAAYMNEVSMNEKLRAAKMGRIDPLAYWIVESIHRIKHRNKFPGEPEQISIVCDNCRTFSFTSDVTEPHDLISLINQKRIVDAVGSQDQRFLESLIQAMKLWESGDGVANPLAAKVIECHVAFGNSNALIPPTAAQLQDSVRELHPGLVLDIRTIRSICSSRGVTLSPGKKGRPGKKAGKKKKPLPL
jgi:hypothetical protein